MATYDGCPRITRLGFPPTQLRCLLTRNDKRLGFKDREQYEGSVRKLLMDDDEALRLVRALFSTLGMDVYAA